MLKFVKNWYDRYFSDEEATILVLLLALGFFIVITMGGVLAPVLAALVLAYLMQGAVVGLIKWNVPRPLSLFIVYSLFLSALLGVLFVLLPLTWRQLIEFSSDQLPQFVKEGNQLLKLLPERYPELFTEKQAADIVEFLNGKLKNIVETVVSFSVSSVIPNLLSFVLFIVLVPMLVFFFLKDKSELVSWFVSFLPKDRPFLGLVAQEMDEQLSNYVRGKAVEILIVGAVTYIALMVIGVNYAALLGLLVGLSVVIPYIGAMVVTIPVMMVGYIQFGWGTEFFTVVIVYGIIQGLDGNVLVPLLFSEVVNLHPVAIIVAVLAFGGVWGIWGVFFAIPLATLIKVVTVSWPGKQVYQDEL